MEDENIHLFCECDIACGIWEEVVNWYNFFGYNREYLSDLQNLFGDTNCDPTFNRIILTTKIAVFTKQKF